MRAFTLALFVSALVVAAPAGGRQAQDPEMTCLARCPRVPDVMGSTKPDPDCVRRCLMAGGSAVPIRFTPAWDASPLRQLNKAVIEDLVTDFDASDSTFAEFLKDWMLNNVSFNRVSTRSSPRIPVPEMRAGADKLEFEDRYFTVSDARRVNLLAFELAKVIWLRMNQVEAGTREVTPAQKRALEAIHRLVARHGGLFLELKHLRHDGESLSDLVDGGDAPSAFGYAIRAMVLDMAPPARDRAEEWRKVKAELEAAVTGFLTTMSRRPL